MVMVMVEVFTNSAENCLRLKGKQVENIFQLVTTGDEAIPELIDLLQVIIKVCIISKLVFFSGFELPMVVVHFTYYTYDQQEHVHFLL